MVIYNDSNVAYGHNSREEENTYESVPPLGSTLPQDNKEEDHNPAACESASELLCCCRHLSSSDGCLFADSGFCRS